MAGALKPVGSPTRGTTNPNRLRRIDRWMVSEPLVRGALSAEEQPLVVDLGYGASPVTTVELARRLAAVRPGVRVLGLELDPDRVAAGKAVAEPPLLDFRRGGFELAGTRPAVVRAFNVLRQYAEEDVVPSWEAMLSGIAPGGVLVEGTCDEIGRLCAWVTLTHDGPRTLTLACRTANLERPSTLAQRLPKALIHCNVEGEPVHALMSALDSCWAAAAPYGAFGQRARWTETVRLLAERGWPVLGRRDRWRLGELTLPWHAVSGH
ncbi:class I SAM-dependent methyltransferase [Saccharomonospora xinjiangensis]|uniref:class I SAM-dependent methyltransferase n=1 Tax=Saccharomonospora xinjiangensis TaxID=75294 RepID=UPI00106F5CF6|nr:class I SAM-dependent methyltransferase [Saccharomonospora xinjiangensis]QBQ58690.1 hypothetical protein EYD13_01515 [Saccharomonospora xinjiangensis]